MPRFKIKDSTAEQDVKVASEAVRQALPHHQTQSEPQVFHRLAKHAVQSSTRNVPPVSVVQEAISAVPLLISVAPPIGVKRNGADAIRKAMTSGSDDCGADDVGSEDGVVLRG